MGAGDPSSGLAGGGFATGSVSDNDGMSSLSDAFGTGRGAYGGDAGMIGDFFGGSYSFSSNSFTLPTGSKFSTPIAGGDRRFKIAENNSPFPTDRVMFSYHHFANALNRFDGGSGNLDRYMFGVEKTFFDGWWSVEVRAPVVSGLNSDQVLNNGGNPQSTEVGNLGFAVKRALFRGDTIGASVGLGIITPTADDARIFLVPGSDPTVVVANEAVFLQPFLGLSYRPDDQLFSQLVLQVDVDTRGNTVTLPGFGPQLRGVIQDQALLYLDWSTGYWLFRNPGARISGLAPMIELHYTSTLENTDVVDLLGIARLSNEVNRVDVFNLTAGARTEFFGASYLTTAVVVPLRNGSNKFFDAELGVQFVRTF